MEMKNLNLARALLAQVAGDDCTCDTDGCGNTCTDCTNTQCTLDCSNSTTTRGLTIPGRAFDLDLMSRHLGLLQRRLNALEAIFETPTGRKLKDQMTEEVLQAAIDDLTAERDAIVERREEDE